MKPTPKIVITGFEPFAHGSEKSYAGGPCPASPLE